MSEEFYFSADSNDLGANLTNIVISDGKNRVGLSGALNNADKNYTCDSERYVDCAGIEHFRTQSLTIRPNYFDIRLSSYSNDLLHNRDFIFSPHIGGPLERFNSFSIPLNPKYQQHRKHYCWREIETVLNEWMLSDYQYTFIFKATICYANQSDCPILISYVISVLGDLTLASCPNKLKLMKLIQKNIDSFSFWDLVPVVGNVRSVTSGVRSIKKGESFKGSLKVAMGLSFLALDFITLGQASSAIKGAVTGACKLGAGAVTKEAVKTTGKGVFTIAAQEVANQAVSQATKEVGKKAAQEVGKKAAQEVGKKAAQELGKKAAQEVGKKAAQELGKKAAQELGKTAAQELGKKAVQEVGKKAAQEVGKKAAQELGKKAAQELGKKAAQEVGKKAAQELGKKAAQEVGKKAAQELGKKAAQEVGKKAAQELGKKAAQEVGKKAAQELGKKAAQEVGKKAAQELGKKAAQEVGKKAAQELGKKAAQEVGKKAAQELGKKAAQELGKKAAQELGKKAVQEVGKKAAQELGKKAAQEVGKKAAQEVATKLGKDALINVNKLPIKKFVEVTAVAAKGINGFVKSDAGKEVINFISGIFNKKLEGNETFYRAEQCDTNTYNDSGAKVNNKIKLVGFNYDPDLPLQKQFEEFLYLGFGLSINIFNVTYIESDIYIECGDCDANKLLELNITLELAKSDISFVKLQQQQNVMNQI